MPFYVFLVIALVFQGFGLEQPERTGRLLQGGVPLNFGEPVTDVLDNDVFRHVYFFTGQVDDVVAISMTRNDGDLDPYLLLTDEQGAILALSDDDGPGSDARIASKRIPAAGRYFVIATRFGQVQGSTSGSYTLLLERVGTGDPETTFLQYGDSVLGRVSLEEPLVFYFLRAQRGDVINIALHRTSGNLDPLLDLATADGRILVSNDDDPLAEGTLDAGITNYTVLESGVYLIVATHFGREAGDTEGSYVLSVTLTPPDELGTRFEEARLIDYGMTLDGTIDDDVPVRYYRFDARRGDVITVTMTAEAGNLDPLVKLADVSLVEMAQDNDSGGGGDARIAAYTLPATGTYYLLATRNREQEGQTSGDYSLQLSGRPGIVGGNALEITYGASVSGLIEDTNSSEEYVFFGQQGDVIQITMERASNDLDSLVTLYDSSRKQIAFDDDSGGDQNARIERFVLPRDDMYILVASRYERAAGTTSGAYILTLELVRAGN
jgi:hypothetical protein